MSTSTFTQLLSSEELLLITFIQRYSLLPSRLTALLSHLIMKESDCSLEYSPPSGVFTALFWLLLWLVPREIAAASAHVLCTPYNHAPVYSVTSCKATNVEGARVLSCNLPLALLAE